MSLSAATGRCAVVEYSAKSSRTCRVRAHKAEIAGMRLGDRVIKDDRCGSTARDPSRLEQTMPALRSRPAVHRLEQAVRHCPVCGYLYERDYGDVWWVWIVTDRIPVAIGIILLYFGFRVSSFWMGVVFFGSLSLPLLLTIPRRFGLAIAITYLIRRRWPDPKDNFPQPTC